MGRIVLGTKPKEEEPAKEEEWAIAGLLHDGDYTPVTPEKDQGVKVARLLEKEGHQLSNEVKHAMAAHNWHATGVEPVSKMDWALFACDSLTGLITAAALVLPDNKLGGVEVKSVRKRFKEKSFAAGANREHIASCSELGLELDEFLELGLKAMQGIADELGL